MKSRLPLILLSLSITLSTAQAVSPEGFLGLGLSSGDQLYLEAEGGLRLLRADYGILGAEVAAEIPSDGKAFRGRLGAFWRNEFSDGFEVFVAAGGRLNNISPFRGGLYARGGAVITLEGFHLKPYYQYNFREGEQRLGLVLEWQSAYQAPVNPGVKINDDWTTSTFP